MSYPSTIHFVVSISQPVSSGRLRSQAQARTQTEYFSAQSNIHQCLHSILNTALKIHETPRGFSLLCGLGNRLFGEEKEASRCNFRDYHGDMKTCVTQFLTKLRHEFAPIELDDLQDEAYTIRYDWGTDMNRWRPREAGVVTLNQAIMYNMLQAHSNMEHDRVARQAYETFKFQMAIVLAHEIVHLFTGYFYSPRNFKTPPRLVATGYEEADSETAFGELGRLWEQEMFGGIIELFADRSNPLRERQAGNVFLVGPPSRFRNIRKAKQVHPQYITDFLQGRFAFPVPDILLNQTEKIARDLTSMTVVRQHQPFSALIELGRVVPLPQGSGTDPIDPNARYRRAPDAHRQQIQGSNRSFWRRLV